MASSDTCTHAFTHMHAEIALFSLSTSQTVIHVHMLAASDHTPALSYLWRCRITCCLCLDCGSFVQSKTILLGTTRVPLEQLLWIYATWTKQYQTLWRALPPKRLEVEVAWKCFLSFSSAVCHDRWWLAFKTVLFPLCYIFMFLMFVCNLLVFLSWKASSLCVCVCVCVCVWECGSVPYMAVFSSAHELLKGWMSLI